jgi:hypothetical protein
LIKWKYIFHDDDVSKVLDTAVIMAMTLMMEAVSTSEAAVNVNKAQCPERPSPSYTP